MILLQEKVITNCHYDLAFGFDFQAFSHLAIRINEYLKGLSIYRCSSNSRMVYNTLEIAPVMQDFVLLTLAFRASGSRDNECWKTSSHHCSDCRGRLWWSSRKIAVIRLPLQRYSGTPRFSQFGKSFGVDHPQCCRDWHFSCETSTPLKYRSRYTKHEISIPRCKRVDS